MKNELEKNLFYILNNLKNNYAAITVKAEFEDEGASFQEVSKLCQITKTSGLDFTLKIGGCGALNDIQKAMELDVNTIVAPMIESPYALKKFVLSVKKIYQDKIMPKLFVNIETICGVENFDSILSEPSAQDICGVVVGRFDLAKSIDLGCKDIHSEKISNIVNNLSKKTKNYGKVFIVGGGINEKSIKVFEKLESIEKFETRKIVFSAKDFLKTSNITGILEAMKFELVWLEYKLQNFDCNTNVVLSRINSLKARYDELLKAEQVFCIN